MNESLHLRAQTIRAEIASGALRGAAFLEVLLSIDPADRDAWVDALLRHEDPPADEPNLPRGAVPYLPCGVDEILEMIREGPVRADDVLVDLGSGLGRVVVLANLISGARAHGIEIQAPLVHTAQATCTELGLTGVSFEHADAATAHLDGSIFFLYAPFNGELLTRVLARLEEVARRRAITVCAVGLELREVAWLKSRRASGVSLTLYDAS